MNANEHVKTDIEITHNLGLHLRAAGALVQLANQFEAEITIRRAHLVANGKSIMSVLSLAASVGTQLELEATGPDAKDCIDAIVGLVQRDFDLHSNS